MTVLNFPASPTVGDTYTENNVIYTWNGTFWAANNAQDLDARFVNVTGDTMTGNLTVPSINGGQLAGFRNLIINGDFRINQRGGAKNPGVVNQYGFDRWRSNSATVIEQIIEDAPAGQYTLSVGSGGSAAVMTATIAGTSVIASGPSNTPLTFSYDGTGNLSVLVPDAVSEVQVERGSVATPFEHRPIGIELALCQRYYQKLGGFIVSSDVSGTSRATWSFKTEMRIAPAVNWAADGNLPTSTVGPNTDSVTGVRTLKVALAPGSTADAEL